MSKVIIPSDNKPYRLAITHLLSPTLCSLFASHIFHCSYLLLLLIAVPAYIVFAYYYCLSVLFIATVNCLQLFIVPFIISAYSSRLLCSFIVPTYYSSFS